MSFFRGPSMGFSIWLMVTLLDPLTLGEGHLQTRGGAQGTVALKSAW